MAFRKKSHTLLGLAPDLLIVPECENHDRLKLPPDVPQPTCFMWEGKNQSKGLALLSYTHLSFELHPSYNPKFQYILPVQVHGGAFPFTLLAMWVVPIDSDLRYITQIQQALYEYESLLVDPVLIVGDFNSNKIWDVRRRTPYFAQVAQFLEHRHIFSLYHTFFAEAFGEETQPTFYFYRKQARPYHIDYMFASLSLRHALVDITVGGYDDWRQFSDHVPMTATFRI